jgi:hypothetical protein
MQEEHPRGSPPASAQDSEVQGVYEAIAPLVKHSLVCLPLRRRRPPAAERGHEAARDTREASPRLSRYARSRFVAWRPREYRGLVPRLGTA